MKRILIVVFVILSLSGYSQKKIIELSWVPVDIQMNGFYISDVIDARENQDNIGFIQTGTDNKTVAVDLKNGLESSVYNYMKASYQFDTSQTPIVIKVVHLRISERSSFSSERGRAEIKLEFYKVNNDKYAKVFEYETFVEKQASDVTKGHEERIRSVINTCIKNFNKSDWKSKKPEYQAPVMEDPETKRSSETGLSYDDKEASEWVSLLRLNKSFGLNASGWGFSYYGYSTNTTRKWFFPFVISFDWFTIDADYFEQFNYYQASLNYSKYGISIFRKLSDRFYANATFVIPLGSETLTNFSGRESKYFLIGFAPSQGISFIPVSEYGLTFSVEVFEHFMTSQVYATDFGVNVKVGFKF